MVTESDFPKSPWAEAVSQSYRRDLIGPAASGCLVALERYQNYTTQY